MEGAHRGETTLYIGSSETEAEIQDIARSHGWDISGIELRQLSSVDEEVQGPEQTILHPVEVELPRTMERLMAIVDEVKPERLVIDSLTELRLLAREENWFRDQIKTLQQHLADRRCTALLTDLRMDEQPVVRSVVHGVIELEQATTVYGPDRRRLRIAKMRGMSYLTGYHDLTIEAGGMRIFPRLVAAEHRERRESQTISSGLPELDTLLGGGLERSTSTLFMGPTGTGKSTLVTHYVVAAARRGEKSAMYIFDERIHTLLQRAAGLGLELEEHVRAGLVTLRQVDPAELTPGQFSQAVADAIDDGASIVSIDSLNGYAYAMPEERLLGLHLHELLSYLNQRGVATLGVLTQHGLHRSAETLDVSYIADTTILLRPFEFRGEVRKAISVQKHRSGPHERTIREFDLSGGRITIGQPLEEFSGVISGNLQYLGGMLERPKEQ
jgi:circadian clock protein KaiC